jgi:hypothetical protein
MTNFNQVGTQQLTVSSSAVALTPPTNITTRHVLIYSSAAIRWKGGGTDPTAAIGMYVPAGGYIDFTDPVGDYSGLIQNMEFIAVGGNSTLDIIYFN